MSATQTKIQRAILSVTDKTGLVEFARKLAGMGVELVSTGGTAKLLRDSGISGEGHLRTHRLSRDARRPGQDAASQGARRHSAPARESLSHRSAVAEHGIEPIDMVVVNLYAFEKTAAKPGVAFEDIIENIDIGGPSMVRSAAKNFQDVAIVTSPADYDAIARRDGDARRELSRGHQVAAGAEGVRDHCSLRLGIASTLERSQPPTAISSCMTGAGFPRTLRLRFSKAFDLRYGENPHQKAALYCDGSAKALPTASSSRARNSATTTSSICRRRGTWRRSSRSRCAPSSSTPTRAARRSAATWPRPTSGALECDPVSAFGGVIGVNRPDRSARPQPRWPSCSSRSSPPRVRRCRAQIFAAKKNLRLVRSQPCSSRSGC